MIWFDGVIGPLLISLRVSRNHCILGDKFVKLIRFGKKTREGVVFNADYLHPYYDKYGISIDTKTKTLQKNGKKISYSTQFNPPASKLISKDKIKSKELFIKHQIPTPKYYKWDKNLTFNNNMLFINNMLKFPIVIYEAILEGIILFLILIYFINKNYLKKPGLISGLFLIFYSLFRFFVEFFRVPDEQIGYLILNLTMGQIISLVFAATGIILFYLKNENK